MTKEQIAWLRIQEFYGKNMPDNPEPLADDLTEAMYTYATSLFCDELMKDAYKVAELDYEETQVPPQKVQDILRAMWDLPKHQVLRKICEEKARRVILRVEFTQKSPDGWVYCDKCRGDHAPPACKLEPKCQYVFTIGPNYRNGHQCERSVAHTGAHFFTKSPAGSKCCELCAEVRVQHNHIVGEELSSDCDVCLETIKSFSDTVIGVWLPPGEVLWGFDECVHPKCGVNQCANTRSVRAFHCHCGTWYVRPEESKRKQYINSIYGNAKAKVLAQPSYSSIAEELAAEPKKARDFYEQALESLNTKLIQDCIWRLEEAGKLEYAKHLRGYLDGLQLNGVQVGHWQNANTWGYSCQGCGRSATHSHSLDRALCIPTHEDSRVCLVSHARPDMKDKPGEFETGTWVSPGTWKYSCACGSFGGVDVQEQFCHCSKCYKLFARPDMKDKPV